MSMGHISRRIERLPEYIFSRLEKEVAEVEKESGRPVLDFGAGDPDVRTSQIYIEKLAELVREPDSHLYPGYRALEFRTAVCEWYKKRFGLDLAPDEVVPLLGGKNGLSLLPLVLADNGDEVLVPDPGYPGFVGPALALGISPVPYNLLAPDFHLSIAEIAKAITPKTKSLWINFPSNPTGVTIEKEELTKVVAFARERNISIVYDNAYSEITFEGYVAPSILQIPGAKDIAVEIGSFSKTFSFAGFRMGWLVGNSETVQALAKVKSQFDSGMSLPLSRLGAFTLSNQDMDWYKKMLKTYQARRDIIAGKLRSLGLEFSVPKGSLYLWAKIPDSATDSESYSIEMLREKHVLFTPGSAYGKNGERYVRVSICTDVEKIDEYL